MKLATLPKVTICVAYANKGVITKIFGHNHVAPIVKEGIRSNILGEVLLRDAIKYFNLSLSEISYLR